MARAAQAGHPSSTRSTYREAVVAVDCVIVPARVQHILKAAGLGRGVAVVVGVELMATALAPDVVVAEGGLRGRVGGSQWCTRSASAIKWSVVRLCDTFDTWLGGSLQDGHGWALHP
jgi:hypothetical protein